MGIAIYLALIVTVVALTIVAVSLAPGYARRSVRSLPLAVTPFLLVGVLSLLTLNAGGQPTLEWKLPLCGVVVIWLFCRSDPIFRRAGVAMLVLCVVLVGTFLALLGSGDYTAEPRRTAYMMRFRRPAVAIQPLWHSPLTHLHRVEVEGTHGGG